MRYCKQIAVPITHSKAFYSINTYMLHRDGCHGYTYLKDDLAALILFWSSLENWFIRFSSKGSAFSWRGAGNLMETILNLYALGMSETVRTKQLEIKTNIKTHILTLFLFKRTITVFGCKSMMMKYYKAQFDVYRKFITDQCVHMYLKLRCMT